MDPAQKGMTRIVVELPDDIAKRLESAWRDVSRGTLKAIALEAYRDGTLSREQVGRVLGLSSASPVAIHVGPSAGAATRASPAPRVTGAAQPVGSRASAHAPSSGEPQEVIARGSHQQPAHARDQREAVWPPQLWSLGQQLAGGRQFVQEESGAESRFVRHHASISRTWSSASGVMRTGSVTAGGDRR
jgi:hypothetical protein